MRPSRAALNFMLDAWRRRTLEIGPLVITTHQRVTEREWNAYGIGRDVAAAAGFHAPRPLRQRHLHSVS